MAMVAADQDKKGGRTLPDGRPKTYVNSLGQHVALSFEIFEQMFGSGFTSQRAAKEMTKMDFSGPQFMLETLEGPEGGIMMEILKPCRNYVKTVNVANNALTDINCLDRKRRGSGNSSEFPVLICLVASRNQILDVTLSIESLQELNLAYNELELMPDTSGLPNLQKLILAHNRIKGTMRPLAKNKRLRELLIHDNQFTWRPTEFEAQMQILKASHLYRLTIWPNPFAMNFPEYQFLAVTIIETLTSLDGYFIDQDLKLQLQNLEEDMRDRDGLDFSIFDIKVDERQSQLSMVKETEESVSRSQIPTLTTLLRKLEQPLDHPDQLIKYVYEFAGLINYLWNASYTDRQSRVSMDIKDQEELKVQVGEFGDKMQQLLGRFDSVQDVLVKCLVRLCASGCRPFSEMCANLLAEWIDALPPELSEKLQTISTPLFRELRVRMLPGMQSFQDDPLMCFQASNPQLMEADEETENAMNSGFFGKKNHIAETAEILAAFGKFGTAGIAQRPVHNNRAIVLRPLLPALCRHSRKALGEDQPRDDKQKYPNFGPFDGAELSSPPFQGPKVGFADVCVSRANKMSCGGFVVSEVATSSSLLQAQFLHESADAISGMRVPTEGQLLYVMPAVAQVVEEREEEVENIMTWEVWHNCLNVLCVATSDSLNAARCVLTYQVHQFIPEYEERVFNESLLNIANEATLAFTVLLHLARNLTVATKAAAQEAKAFFTQKKFHIKCWRRVRTRMNQVGASRTENTMLLSALVRVVFEMSKGEQGHIVMKDLSEGMEDVFNTMLEIAANTEAPDPLMLAASLETLWMFLCDEHTRKQVVNTVLTKLHDLAILLPYIKGPIIGDVANNKYQDLWRQCEIKYGTDSHGPERMPQLFEGGKNSDWRKKVPEIKDMRNPLMHRVMLGVVRLIELVSDQAEHDLAITGEFQRVNHMLDENDREDMLIGPQNGLILVPDYDVKIAVLRVIGSTLVHSPQQFKAPELGWILRYLTSKNLGYGRQEEFLIEVIKLIKLLVEDNTKTGWKFRQQFAKSAIRQAYDILKVNSARESAGGRDAEMMKTELSLAIVDFLGTCSKPRTGGLRPFLRRVDFLMTVKDVMKQEDGKAYGIRESLLRTWTGRNLREVLVPLVTMNELDVKGLGRYRALVRLADVLMGKMDYDTLGNTLKSTDEAIMWPGDNAIRRTLLEHDDYLKTDTIDQQSQFLFAGLEGVWGFVDRLFMSNAFQNAYSKSLADVNAWSVTAKTKVLDAWYLAQGNRPKAATRAKHSDGPAQQGETKLLSLIESRLRCINLRVQTRYFCNLSNFIQAKKVDSLTLLAQVFEKEVKDNMKLQTQLYGDDDFELLAGDDMPEELDNQYNINGKFYTMNQLKAEKKKLTKCRQHTGDLSELLVQAHAAQIQLKKYLLGRGDLSNPKTEEWASRKWEVGDEPEDEGFSISVRQGLHDFLADNECTVTDPGIKTKEMIQRVQKYKYHGDLTRCRSIARLLIEVKDVPTMIKLVKDLKANTRFQIFLIRNRFKYPTALGSRFIQVFVEVVTGPVRHIAELRLVLVEGGPGGFLNKETSLRLNIENTIRAYGGGNLDDDAITEVSEFLIYEMCTRSIRSGDVMYIASAGEKYLSVDPMPKEMVYVREGGDEAPLNWLNMFWITRREWDAENQTYKETYGPVKTGDIIMLQNYFTENFIDISSTNHGVRSRFSDPDAEANLRMIVEAAPERKQEGIGGLAAFAVMDDLQGDSAAAKDKTKKKHFHKELPKNVHNSAKIMLKVYGEASPQRRITLRKAQGWGEDRQGLKAEPRYDDELADPQIFTFFREGSLDCYLEAPNLATAEANAICIRDARTEEQVQEKMLLSAYMAGMLATQAPLEGGVFRRSPPTFTDIAHKQSSAKRGAELQKEEDAEQGLGIDLRSLSAEALQRQLAPMTVAAFCRCIYALIEAPAFPEARIKTLDEVLGTIDSRNRLTMMSRFLALAIAGSTNEKGVVICDGLCTASLGAKVLRTFSKCLLKIPANSMPADDTLPDLVNESWKRAQRDREESGLYDQQRIQVLQILSNYIKEILTPPLLQRLAVASQKPLNMPEVTLLKELAHCVDVIARTFFGNELRMKADQEALENRKEEAANQPEAIEGDTSGLALTGAGGMMGGSFGGSKSVEEKMFEKGQILGEQAVAIFASLVPPQVVRVLVHAMLYGIRREAQAFTHNRNIGQVQDSVKLMSSLVQRSINALAAAMYGCEGYEAFAMDYNVCEAISQAMCQGAQMVPRARVTQLMQEWHTEKFRRAAQDKLDAGDVGEADTTGMGRASLVPQPTETAYLVAFAYTGFVMEDSLGSYQPDLERKLVVLTSRLNLAIFDIPEPNDDGTMEAPTEDMLTFKSFRNLSWLKHVVTHPRIAQFLGFVWEKGKSGSTDGFQHEVFIFECFNRRKAFHDALKNVVRFREKRKDPVTGKQNNAPDTLEIGPHKFVPEILPPVRFSLLLRRACKDTNMVSSECQLVTVTFVKAEWTHESKIEAMILTRDAIVCISLIKFLSAYKTEFIECDDATPEPKLVDVDSDDDADEIAPMQHFPQQSDMDDMVKLEPVRGVWEIVNLAGVWFMASEEPKMKVDFGSVQEITFLTEGARQRFRQHLACTLKTGEDANVTEQKQQERGKKWKVQPTRKDNMPEVKKELKETERGLMAHIDRVKAMEILALKH